jgi:mannonate dehydratase
VWDKEDQDLADPVRLALPLDLGVKVVMLHSARDGEEQKPWPADGLRLSYFERFVQIMKTYKENAFGEISMIPYLGTEGRLKTLIEDPELRCRLVNGTDYPGPAIWMINPVDDLWRQGYLDWKKNDGVDDGLAGKRRDALKTIYKYDPLLFDFVLKRTIRIDGWKKLPAATFFGIETKIKRPTLGCPPLAAS